MTNIAHGVLRWAKARLVDLDREANDLRGLSRHL